MHLRMLALKPGLGAGPEPELKKEPSGPERPPIVYGPWSWDAAFLARGLTAMGGVIVALVIAQRCWSALGADDPGFASARLAAVVRVGVAIGLAVLVARGAVRAWRELRSGDPTRME